MVETGELEGLDSINKECHQYSLIAESEYVIVLCIFLNSLSEDVKEELIEDLKPIYLTKKSIIDKIIENKLIVTKRMKPTYRSDIINDKIKSFTGKVILSERYDSIESKYSRAVIPLMNKEEKEILDNEKAFNTNKDFLFIKVDKTRIKNNEPTKKEQIINNNHARNSRIPINPKINKLYEPYDFKKVQTNQNICENSARFQTNKENNTAHHRIMESIDTLNTNINTINTVKTSMTISTQRKINSHRNSALNFQKITLPLETDTPDKLKTQTRDYFTSINTISESVKIPERHYNSNITIQDTYLEKPDLNQQSNTSLLLRNKVKGKGKKAAIYINGRRVKIEEIEKADERMKDYGKNYIPLNKDINEIVKRKRKIREELYKAPFTKDDNSQQKRLSIG